MVGTACRAAKLISFASTRIKERIGRLQNGGDALFGYCLKRIVDLVIRACQQSIN
jgi:hypothetical protein